MKRLILAVLLALGLIFINEPLQAANILYYTSSPGSWIGQGQTVTFTSPATAFSASRIGHSNNGVRLSFDDNTDKYYLELIGPGQTLPTVGLYPDAAQYPFNGSSAGLFFYGNYRADNTNTGYFKVLQADCDISGNIVSFAVDFKQYDEGETANWVSGSFRYNSNIPIPEPATFLLLGLGAAIAIRKQK
jgi:hypothetical protein